jgi:small subunit ribosomal protein S6
MYCLQSIKIINIILYLKVNEIIVKSRIYECVFLASSSIPEDGITNLVNNFHSIFTENNIKVEKHENWGLLSLAYKIKNHTKANFFMFIINGNPESVQRFKNKLKYNELIIRYMMQKKERKNLILSADGISLKIPQQH